MQKLISAFFFIIYNLTIIVQSSNIPWSSLEETDRLSEFYSRNSNSTNKTIEEGSKHVVNTCSKKICDETGGFCVNQTHCECYDQFTTLAIEYNYKFCNYQKKSRFSTAIIELFVGFGVGHIYSDRKIAGYFKLMIFIIFCCVAACSLGIGVKFEQEHPNSENAVVKFFFCIYACIFNIILSWQIFDFIMFVFGFYNDGNDIPFA